MVISLENDKNNNIKDVKPLSLVSDEDLENMNFYELAYYMQTLNLLDKMDYNKDEEQTDE